MRVCASLDDRKDLGKFACNAPAVRSWSPILAWRHCAGSAPGIGAVFVTDPDVVSEVERLLRTMTAVRRGDRAAAATRSQSVAGPRKQKSLPREEMRQAFPKEPNSDWEEECRCSNRRRLGGGVGRLNSKRCGRCIASIVLIIPQRWTVPMSYAALQLCREYKSERLTIRARSN